MKKVIFFIVTLLMVSNSFNGSCRTKDYSTNRLKKAFKAKKNGWVYVHLEGSPTDIGYQHGYLLSNEIDTAIQSVRYFLQHETKAEWGFYRHCAWSFLWPKLDPEYKSEINGIVQGLRKKGFKYDSLDITAYNALEELAFYYVPQLMNKEKPGSGDNKAPGNCSAFIATGSYTSDGKIVIGHNNWTNYIYGQYWNIVADIVPQKGNHIIMDCMPGFIHSGDDFFINSKGILITETTIDAFKGFDSTQSPEFMRARKAAQYSNSIDDVIKIFTTNNNGGYANDWLIGDTKTNEVAQLELGLKNFRVWRSKDTAIISANFPSDEKLIKEETTFNIDNEKSSPYTRKVRMRKLVADLKGKLNVETGKALEADHFDVWENKNQNNGRVICGHIDEDTLGSLGSDYFYPAGAVQAKITTSALAGKMTFWAHMGHPCGQDFVGAPFYEAHPQYQWQEKYLKNMKAYPWTLFAAKEIK